MRYPSFLLMIAFAVMCATPMTSFAKTKSKKAPKGSAEPVAQAEMKDAKGDVVGNASFLQSDHGVKMVIDVKGLAPGAHGIHFHENGKCEGPDFKSAGGHLNPAHKDHGLNNPNGPHAGDLPNLIVSADGTGHGQFTTDRVTLGSGDNSLFRDGGAAVVIHAKVDDQKSNPSGESGDRIACGIVTKVK